MKNWYVITSLSRKEKSMIEYIKTYNAEKSIDDIMPFVPTKETIYKTSAFVKEETSPIFQGYIFMETSRNCRDFLNYMQGLRRTYSNPMRVLSYGDSDELAIRREEQVDLMMLMDSEKCIKISRGYKVDGKVTIINGALKGHEGEIKEIDIYRMRAWIEIKMHERPTLIKVGLELLNNPHGERF